MQPQEFIVLMNWRPGCFSWSFLRRSSFFAKGCKIYVTEARAIYIWPGLFFSQFFFWRITSLYGCVWCVCVEGGGRKWLHAKITSHRLKNNIYICLNLSIGTTSCSLHRCTKSGSCIRMQPVLAFSIGAKTWKKYYMSIKLSGLWPDQGNWVGFQITAVLSFTQ